LDGSPLTEVRSVETGEDATAVSVLADFVSDLRPEEIPPAVLAHARLAILDTLGAGIAAARSPDAVRLIEGAASASGRGPCRVWGSLVRLAPAPAALVNGSRAHLLELDDFGGCGHSGAVVVPAALAVAQAEGASGASIIAGVVGGYEVAARILAAAGGYRVHNRRGWHSTGTCGAFGAGAAAARVLGLDRAHAASAIAIAGSLAAGLWAFEADGAITKRLNAGRAADNGVTGAYLARRGLAGPMEVIEAPYGGFLSTLAGDTSQLHEAVAGLRTEWQILDSGFKLHAACRGVHGLLDAVLELRAAEALDGDRITRVTVFGGQDALRRLGKPAPVTPLQAQLSIEYSVAVALLDGVAGPEQFDEERLHGRDVAAFLDRVALIEDADAAHLSTIEVTTSDGRSVRRSIGEARGGPSDPLSESDLVAKFHSLTGPWLPAEDRHRIVEFVLDLEAHASIDELSDLLTVAAV
jgi:2-methylcitrate dehydratase PrpD